MTELSFKFETGIEKTVLSDRRDLLRCLQQSYIYIRIPRTGSTSISNMVRSDNAWPHFYARLLRDLIGKNEYEKRVSFASVRNPWDRLVSWYAFNCHDYRADRQQSEEYRNLGFKGWIMKGCPHRGWSPHHHAHQPSDTIPQMGWIVDENGEVIVDHIVRLENLQQDFEKIRVKLNLPSVTVPNLNVSSTRQFRDYRKYYDAESAEKVKELYAHDIEYFGYEF